VSVAWFCFDKDKTYQKHGTDYVKCNQLGCGAEFKLNPSTSTNLSRHVQKMHPSLLPQKKAGMNVPKQSTLSYSRKVRLFPSFSQENFEQYLTNLFIGQDSPFQLLESTEF